MNDFLLLRHIKKRYGSTYALDDVSLSFPRTGFIGIVGPSGSGKSTLLNIISGVDRAYLGSVVSMGVTMSGMAEEEASNFRLRNIGYVFQSFCLLESEKVGANVLLPLLSLYNEDGASIKRKAKDLLRFVGLEKKLNARVNTLSGGEKQRVAIARALSTDPKIILADEPTGSLDEASSKMVFDLLKAISLHRLVLVVSHDEERVRSYADQLVRISDGKISEVLSFPSNKNFDPPSSIRLKGKKATPRLPTFFLYRHAASLMKTKRIRSYLCGLSIAAGMLGLGLATYIYSSIGDEVKTALNGFVKDGTLIATPQNAIDNPLSNIRSPSIELAKNLASGYSEVFSSYGVTLKTNYDTVFQDEDNFYLFRSSASNIPLSYFRAENINDYLQIDDTYECYPITPSEMEVAEVILGLPYKDMFQICMSLNIERSFEGLGDYIATNRPSLLMQVANYSVGFDDEEMIEIVGVTPTSTPCFLHDDPLWNHHFFVDHLHFYAQNSPQLENMQQLFEIPYLTVEGDFSDFLSSYQKDESLASLVFEFGGKGYMPSIYSEDHPFGENRVYLYEADKYGVSFKEMDQWQESAPSIQGRLPLSSFGYYGERESILTGFPFPFFLSCNLEEAEQIAEECSVMKEEVADLPLDLSNNVVSGSINYAGENSLWVEATTQGFTYGEAPKKVTEVGLSYSLYEKWGEPRVVYVTLETGEERLEGTVIRSFKTIPLLVTGLKEGDHDTIFVPSNWTYDFFLSEARVSGFSLEPQGAVLCFDSNQEAIEAQKTLSEEYPSFHFFSPSQEVGSTIYETTHYIGIALIAFSSLAFVMASLLFLVVMSITVEENAGEDELLFKLGIGRADRKKALRMHSLAYTLRSLIPSLAILTLLEIAVNYFISDLFGSRFRPTLSWSPFLAVIFSSFLFYLILFFGVEFANRAKIRKRRKRHSKRGLSFR